MTTDAQIRSGLPMSAALILTLATGWSCESRAADSKPPPSARPTEAGHPAASATAAVKLRLPPPATTPLGDVDLLPLAPGTKIKSSPLEALKPDDAESWKEKKRTPFTLGDRSLELVTLEYPGMGAALVLLAPRDGGRKMVGIFTVSHGGNGAEIQVAQTATDPSGTVAFALLAITRESRGFDEVPAKSDESFVVLAFTGDQAWLASQELDEVSTASLDKVDEGIRLVGCVARKKKPGAVLALNPETAKLEPAPASVSRTVVCPAKRR